MGQVGQGKDESKPKERDVYEITIDLDLRDDTFYTASNTGNKGLTVGLVMDVFNRLSDIPIKEL